jgi:AAA ATPase domain
MSLGATPYTPGAGTPPTVLAGRREEEERFERVMRGLVDDRLQRNLVATGFRGMGKTVLLRRLKRLSEQEGCVSEFRELQEDGRLGSAFCECGTAVLNGLRPARRVKAGVARALQGLRAVSVEDTRSGFKFALDVDAHDVETLASDMGTILIQIGKLAAAQGRGAFLIFDELQNARETDLRALLTGLHAASQERLPVAVIAGGLPHAVDILAQANSYGERMFDFVPIALLSRVDTIEAIEGPARLRGVQYTSAGLEQMLEFTRGYPFYVQEYGRYVWEAAANSPIQLGDVLSGATGAEDSLLNGFVRMRMGRASADERRLLYGLAALGPGPYEPHQVRAVLRRDARRRTDDLTSSLVWKGHLQVLPGGVVAFTAPRFAEFAVRDGERRLE